MKVRLLILMSGMLAATSSSAADCPSYEPSQLVGTWQSGQWVESGGYGQNTRVVRTADRRVTIWFEVLREDKVEYVVEAGKWQLSDCLYSVAIETVDGKAAAYLEFYEVLELTDQSFVYRHTGTDETYFSWRVPD